MLVSLEINRTPLVAKDDAVSEDAFGQNDSFTKQLAFRKGDSVVKQVHGCLLCLLVRVDLAPTLARVVGVIRTATTICRRGLVAKHDAIVKQVHGRLLFVE